MRKQTVIVETGQKHGLLTVGELVYDVQEHPLFLTTAQSYIQHGRLRECHCECGGMVLYSENVLSSNQLKSCGCLRLKKREELYNERVSRDQKKLHKIQVQQRIREAQYRLKTLQGAPIHLRQTPEKIKEIAELGAELRKLFAIKAHANRKETPKETWKRLNG